MMQCVAFSVCCLHLVQCLKIHHVAAWIILFSLSIIIFYSMGVLHFICPFICWWAFVLFRFLAFMNSAAISIQLLVCGWTYVFNSLGYICRIRISGPYGNFMCNFLRNCQTVFKSACTISLSDQQYMNLYFSTLLPILIIVCPFNYKYLRICEVFNIIMLCNNPHDHWFWLCLSSICTSLKKILLKYFVHFFRVTGFFFYCWVIIVLYIFWILAPNQMYDLQILSPILWVSFYDFFILFSETPKF